MKNNISKEQLIATAAELNTLFGLKPPIPTSGKKATVKTLEEKIFKAANLSEPGDEFSAETLNILTVLGVDLTREPDVQQQPPAEKPAAKPKATSKPKPAAKYTRILSVADALRSAQSSLSKDELVTSADKLYARNGGKSNEKESRWCVNYALPLLARLDVVYLDDNGIVEMVK